MIFREVEVILSQLLGPHDIGDEANRHHGYLVGSTDITDTKNPIDPVPPRLGGPEGNYEHESVFVQRCGNHPALEMTPSSASASRWTGAAAFSITLH